jgi:hypothetical protein
MNRRERAVRDIQMERIVKFMDKLVKNTEDCFVIMITKRDDLGSMDICTDIRIEYMPLVMDIAVAHIRESPTTLEAERGTEQ